MYYKTEKNNEGEYITQKSETPIDAGDGPTLEQPSWITESGGSVGGSIIPNGVVCPIFNMDPGEFETTILTGDGETSIEDLLEYPPTGVLYIATYGESVAFCMTYIK